MNFNSTIVLLGGPVPEPEFALSISRAQELAVGRELQAAGVPRGHVSFEGLLLVLDEVAVPDLVDEDLVVHALPNPGLATRVQRGCGNRVHVGLLHVLDHHGDAVLP